MIELWVTVAVFGAVMKTAFGAYQKHVTLDFDAVEMTYVISVVGVVVFVPLSVFELSQVTFSLSGDVLLSAALKGALSVVATLAVFKAFETTDMSVFVPLVRVSPLFIALLEPLVFPTETYTWTLLLAAGLSVLGAYTVLIEDAGFIEPLRKLNTRGPQLALFVAGCSTVGALATRYAGVENVPTATFALLSNVVMVVLLIAALSYRNSPLAPHSYAHRPFGILGGLSAIREYVIILAYSLATAARVSLVFQLGVIFTVIAGGVFFDERYLGRRLIGSLLIIGGVVIISI